MNHAVAVLGWILVYEEVDGFERIIDAGLGLDFKEFVCHSSAPTFLGASSVRIAQLLSMMKLGAGENCSILITAYGRTFLLLGMLPF
jgi:hypothetical protein